MAVLAGNTYLAGANFDILPANQAGPTDKGLYQVRTHHQLM